MKEEKSAWNTMKEGITKISGKHKDANYKKNEEEKLFLYNSHGCNRSQNFFAKNQGDISNEPVNNFIRILREMDHKFA